MGRHAQKSPRNLKLPHPGYITAGAAVVTLAIGGSGFVFNHTGQPATIQAEAAPYIPEKREPVARIEPKSDKYSDDQVVTSVVDLYGNICTPMSQLTSVARDMSITVENSIGKENEELSSFWSDELHRKAGDLHGAGKVLEDNASSEHVNSDTVKSTAAKAHEVADAFNGYGDTINKDNTADVAGQARTVAANQGDELSHLVQDLANSSPFPTTATAEAVYNLEPCRDVFSTQPELADGETVPAALDFHERLKKGSEEVDAARRLLDNVQVSDDIAATSSAVADVWKARAEAAEAAEKRMNEWKFPEALTAAQLHALDGYADSKNNAAFTWHNVAKAARAQEEALRAATTREQLDSALTAASDDTWGQDVLEEKMLIRVNRVASGGRQ